MTNRDLAHTLDAVANRMQVVAGTGTDAPDPSACARGDSRGADYCEEWGFAPPRLNSPIDRRVAGSNPA
jgi:hypothetical protein